MFVLAFSGFLRFSELSLIRSKDVTFNVGFLSIFIEKSKADLLREGQSVVIAESTGSSICSVALLKLYMTSSNLSFDSEEYPFRPVSGGATLAANYGVPERNLQSHGRWASTSAKNIYVKDSLASRLEVSKSLSL